MRNAHFETDAQNWHIIGTELVSERLIVIIFSSILSSIARA